MRTFINARWNNLPRFRKKKKVQSKFTVHNIGQKHQASQAFGNATTRHTPIKKTRGGFVDNSKDGKSGTMSNEGNDVDDDESTGGSISDEGDCGRSGDCNRCNGGSDAGDDVGGSSGGGNNGHGSGGDNDEGGGGGDNNQGGEVIQLNVLPTTCKCRNCHKEKNPLLHPLSATVDIQPVPIASLSLRTVPNENFSWWYGGMVAPDSTFHRATILPSLLAKTLWWSGDTEDFIMINIVLIQT
jgi:hypothetical protein